VSAIKHWPTKLRFRIANPLRRESDEYKSISKFALASLCDWRSPFSYLNDFSRSGRVGRVIPAQMATNWTWSALYYSYYIVNTQTKLNKSKIKASSNTKQIHRYKTHKRWFGVSAKKNYRHCIWISRLIRRNC